MNRGRPLVLYVVTLSEWGGAQRYVHDLALRLREEFTVAVACAPGGPLVERLRAAGVPVHEIPALVRSVRPGTDLRALWQLHRLMRQLKPDIVHCNSSKAGILGRLAALLAGVPVRLFTAHGWAFTEGRPYWQRWLLARIEALVAPITTHVICVSDHDRDLALQFCVAGPERLTTIHNGVDPRPFRCAARAAGRLAATPAAGRPFTIVMVARLAPPKDPLCLLRAFAMLRAELAAGNAREGAAHAGGRSARLVFVGDGLLRPRLEEAAAALGLTVSRRSAPAADGGGSEGELAVVFAGERPVEEVADLLAAADVFVLASRWEGLPYSVIEAMMAGLPVVASRVGGLPELVVDGLTGFLVPPGDAEALGRALARLLRDPAERARMGEAARRRALAEFTVDRMVAGTRSVYLASLGNRGQRF